MDKYIFYLPNYTGRELLQLIKYPNYYKSSKMDAIIYHIMYPKYVPGLLNIELHFTCVIHV